MPNPVTKSCASCSAEFLAPNANRLKCDLCRVRATKRRTCRECGTDYVTTRHTSDRCAECITASNPRAVQCPLRWCLAHYVPDTRHPHQCKREKPSEVAVARLAVVEAQPVATVLYGPSAPVRAIGLRNREMPSDFLPEALEYPAGEAAA